MSQMLTMFKEFRKDPEAWNMYVRGQAGTGKTTDLEKVVEYCEANDLAYLVVAYTHKACGIIRSKLPEGAAVSTLHSFLKKRPGINEHATKKEHIQINSQVGDPDSVHYLFIDEFSMVGDKDFADIGAAQDPMYEGKPYMKVIYIGDPNQLPPVGDIPAVRPSGKYNLKLTKIYRQANGSPLLDVLTPLISYIEKTAEPKLLPANEAFHRDCDLAKEYKTHNDCVLLAYTNKAVQEWNVVLAGRESPCERDRVFSPNTKHHYNVYAFLEPQDVKQICRPWDGDLGFNSKYKTLEHLQTMEGIEFIQCASDEENEEYLWATVFGHYNYKMALQHYGSVAAASNKAIETKHKQTAAQWAKLNRTDKLARARAKAWRDYMTFQECVICLDFPHAMTVHKSQGSTYKNVCIDVKDLAICAEKSYDLYLKLLYVAISRSSSEVFTN